MSCTHLFRWSTLTCLIALALFLASPAKAVVEGQPIPLTDRRFDAVGLLLTVQPWNPCGGWVSGSCTLIAPNIVMMARHSVQRTDGTLPPANSQAIRVRFRRAANGVANNHFAGNPDDCQTTFQEIYVRETVAAPFAGIDLVLGFLETVPVGITPIGADVSFAFDRSHPIILAGWGYAGRCVQTGDAWTLRNDYGVLPAQRWPSTYTFEYNQMTFSGSCMTWPADVNWVIGNVHDSGAPILIEVPNPTLAGGTELRVVGVVTSYSIAQRLSSWNLAGGQPSILNAVADYACAEFDGLPGVSSEDLFAYVQSWISGEPRANVDQDPGVTLSDLLMYVQHFLGGC